MNDPEMELIAAIRETSHVEGVELHWSPALEVRVHLDAMDWDARQAVIALVDSYIRQPQNEGFSGANVKFTFPEPVEFTEHRIDKASA